MLYVAVVPFKFIPKTHSTRGGQSVKDVIWPFSEHLSKQGAPKSGATSGNNI